MIISSNGFPSRHSIEVNQILETTADRYKKSGCKSAGTEIYRNLNVCHIGENNEGQPSFAVWGDSHGEAILPGINISAKEYDRKGVYVGRGGCLPLLGAHQVVQGYESCANMANEFMLYLSEHPDIETVILISRWAIYAMGDRFLNEKGHTVYIEDSQTTSSSLDENKKVFIRSFERTLKKLQLLGIKVVIVTQVPETEWNIPIDTARSIFLKRNMELRPNVNDYIERQGFIAEVLDKYRYEYNLELVEPYREICVSIYCKIYDNGIPIYRDSNHLTKTYAEKLSKIFDVIFSGPKNSESVY